jgi:NADPH:quinone reductase-like Zn-dependent oxidoreductase
MPHSSRGWFLHVATPDQNGQRGQLVQEDFELSGLAGDEVLAEPLFGCWEGNMEHALSRRPIDICRARGEERVIVGNAGVVRVAAVGAAVRGLKPGQNAITCGTSVTDRFGYPERMLAYDAPGTMGCLATRIKIRERELIPVPVGTKYSLAQWAAFSVRYVTAWSNMELALGTFRLLVGDDEFPHPHVWGWGGGTTLAQLELAKRWGCCTVMLSGHPPHLEQIRKAGITAIDRRPFGQLFFDDKLYAEDSSFRRAYAQAERLFLREVEERTGGERVQIFVDYIGSPVFRVTSKALSRQGIITTAGWKEGMNITYLRAVECIERHQLIHTHYARHSQVVAAVAYAEEHGWMPQVDERIHSFDEIPQLADMFHRGEVGYFPVYSVNAS